MSASTADDWIAWARRQAERANGRPSESEPVTQPPSTRHQGNADRTAGNSGDASGALGKRQGNSEHARVQDVPEAPPAFTERRDAVRRGNARHSDDYSPRKPTDPPWRSRTARRSSTPEAVAAFRDARLRRGWSLTRAAAETGVSRPHLSLLERGLRRPSESVAETIITAYKMTVLEADAVQEISVPWAGRDSPYRTGVEPGDW